MPQNLGPFDSHVRSLIFRTLYTVGFTWLIDGGPGKAFLSVDDVKSVVGKLILLSIGTWLFFHLCRPLSGRPHEGWAWLATAVLYTIVCRSDFDQLPSLRVWVAYTYFALGLTPLYPLDAWPDGLYFEMPEYEVAREASGSLTAVLLLATAPKSFSYRKFFRHWAGATLLWIGFCLLGHQALRAYLLWRGRTREHFRQWIPSSIERRTSLVTTRLSIVLSLQWARFLDFIERGPLLRQQNNFSAEDAFRYEEDLPKSRIRLLVIEKRTLGKMPSCRLITVSVEDAPPYVACSYVWGAAAEKRVIIINGKPQWISQALYDVIRRQQSFKQTATLWVDAICINQSNEREKGLQISIMRQIFEGAHRVEAFVEPRLLPFTQVGIEFVLKQPRGFNVNTRYPIANKACWIQFAEFTAKPWWFRIWILQEAVVPSKLLLINGDRTLDWENFMRLLFRRQNGPEALNKLSDLGCPDSVDSQDFRHVMFLSSLRRAFSSSKRVPLWQLLRSTSRYKATVSHDRIFALLGLTVADAAEQIGVSYSYDLGELYARTMEFVMKEEGSVSPVSLTKPPETIRGYDLPSWVHNWQSSLPAQPLGTRNSLAAATKMPLKTSNMKREGSVLTLRTRRIDKIRDLGTMVPRLESAEQYLNPPLDKMALRTGILGPSRSFVQQVWQLSKELLATDPFSTTANADLERRKLNFWQTLIACPESTDSQQSLSRSPPPTLASLAASTSRPSPPEQLASHYEHLFKCFEWATDLYDDEDAPPYQTLEAEARESRVRHNIDNTLMTKLWDAEKFAALMHIDSGGRRFTVSEKRRIIMVPSDVQPGDEIHLVPSGQTPYVLRPLPGNDLLAGGEEDNLSDEDDEAQSERRYRLVGFCYVAGAMANQLADEGHAWKMASIA